jgi:hypothetical protein
MNLEISNSRNSTWKRLKVQYIAVAAAGALAVSTLIGGVAIREQTAPSSTPSQPQVSPRLSLDDVRNTPAQAFIYVVDSAARAEELEFAIAGAAIEDVSGDHREVLLVDSPQDEAELQIRQGELLSVSGTGTTLIDLRR